MHERAEEARVACMRCDARMLSLSVRAVTLSGQRLNLCPLCWEEFWNWLASRGQHVPLEHGTANGREGLGLSLCTFCKSEFNQWLKPVAMRENSPEATVSLRNRHDSGGIKMAKMPKKGKAPAAPSTTLGTSPAPQPAIPPPPQQTTPVVALPATAPAATAPAVPQAEKKT